MEAYREAAKARYLAKKKAEEEAKTASKDSPGKTDSAPAEEKNKKSDKKSAPEASALEGKAGGDAVGFDEAESKVFVRLLGEAMTVSMDLDPSMPMADFVSAIEKIIPGIDVAAPVVVKGRRIWPLGEVEPPKLLQTKVCQDFAKVNRRTSKDKKVHEAQSDVKARIASIQTEREEAGVDDLKSRMYNELLQLRTYFQNITKPTLGSLGIQENDVIIGQTKEHSLSIAIERNSPAMRFLLDKDNENKDSAEGAWKKLELCSDLQMGKFYDPIRGLYGMKKRSRLSAHAEVYDLDRAVEFATVTLTRRVFEICEKYFAFRRYVYLPIEALEAKAKAACRVLEHANKLSPFDWMTDTDVHEDLKAKGVDLAKGIREVVRVLSMTWVRCLFHHRCTTFLLGLHRRAGAGIMRWCRLAKHFDPNVFGYVFQMIYPPEPSVTPKLFTMPFMREYTSVMHAYGLAETEDQDLVIPVQGKNDHEVA
mmetsp:Transcript_22047/g.42810  ORF Transcript_22047/g.42810 Transcript_22047/m.42810 type:complete len:479 (-) Transcript_22047:162-1598(-)